MASYVAYPVANATPSRSGNRGCSRTGSSGRVIQARALSSEVVVVANVGASSIGSLLTRYDELNNTITSLSTASTSKQAFESKLQDAERRVGQIDQQLRENRDQQSYTNRRYHRNANPHFFHYLQINREEKVRQLAADLENLKAKEQTLEKTKADVVAEVSDLRIQVNRYRDQESVVRRARAEQQQIFDQVVALVPQSERLRMLTAELPRVQADAQVDGGLVTALEMTMRQINEARQLFAQAHSELNRANYDNRNAQFEAQADMFMFDQADFYEVSLQRDRDRNLNLARTNGHRAGVMLQAAFDSFPMEARVRFPEITRNVCKAQVPNLQGANFGQAITDDWIFGAYGAFSNDLMAGAKINRNMNILQHCEQLAQFQAASVQAVLDQVRAQKASLDARVRSIADEVSAERSRLFEETRRSFSSQAPAPMAAAIAIVDPAPIAAAVVAPPPAPIAVAVVAPPLFNNAC